MKPSLFSAALLFLLLVPTSFAQDDATIPAPYDQAQAAQDDIVTTLADRGDFTVLVDALRKTGLDAVFTTDETFTLFSPTDAAFAKLPAGTLDGLTPEQLAGILRYHVLAGAVSSQDAAALATVPSVQGGELTLSPSDAGLTVNGEAVTEADVQASNGVIHVIDTVLLPEVEALIEEAPMEDKMMDKDSNEMPPAPEKIVPTDDQR